jgi:hypothetical protein
VYSNHVVVELDGIIYDVTNNIIKDNLSVLKEAKGAYSMDYEALKIFIEVKPQEWGF